jgi:hypothetical protein
MEMYHNVVHDEILLLGAVHLPLCVLLFCGRALQQKSHLCIPFMETVWAQSQFPHSCVCERFIHTFPGLVHIFPAAEEADRVWEYINRSQTHECRNEDCGRAIPFLGIFVSNFQFLVLVLCSVPAVIQKSST